MFHKQSPFLIWKKQYKLYKKEQTTNGDCMKKIGILLSFLLILTGCGTKEKKLELNKINRELKELTQQQMDYNNLTQVVEEKLDTVIIYEKEEIIDQIGLDETMYENIFFCESKEGIEIYLIVQPKENKKDMVIELIQQYFEAKLQGTENEEEKQIYQNRVEQSYGNNLIYLVGTNLKEKLNKIKEIKEKIFPDMLVLTKEDLETDVHLNMDDIEAYTFAVTDKLNRVEQYIILKYKEETSVRKSMHDYFEQLENEWKEKDNIKYQMLKNRMEKQLGNYLIYLVSTDNQTAYKIIEQSYQ